jgi:hypothetical protein
VVDLASVVANLERIDWDFPRSGTSSRSVHTSHWFPGNFIPQIPAALIQILSQPGDVVVDPFGGSGTTGIEAWRLGRRSRVSDCLSSCVLIMEGKVAIARGGISPFDLNRLINLLAWEHECRSEQPGRNGEGSSATLRDWFSDSTLSQLRFLWQFVEQETGDLQAALKLLFSDLLFACASSRGAKTASGGRRRHHWGWVADNVRPTALVDHDAIAGFRERLLAASNLELFGEGGPEIHRSDARRLTYESATADLIVTSPPYVGVIDYTHANRLLFAWMGWSMVEERTHEIGARYKRKRAGIVQQYLTEMDACWSEMHRVLRPGAFCVVVIGESRKFPGAVDATMQRLGATLDLVWGPVSRSPSRRRVSDREAKPATEQIFVFRKPC